MRELRIIDGRDQRLAEHRSPEIRLPEWRLTGEALAIALTTDGGLLKA